MGSEMCIRDRSRTARPRARSEVRARGRAVRLATPSTLPGPASRTLRLPAYLLVCGFAASLPDARAVSSKPDSGCSADHGAAPAILGLSNGEMPSMVTNLVAFPLGFWWRAPLGLIVVRHGRGMQSAPADESTCGGASRTMTETNTLRVSSCAGVSSQRLSVISFWLD